MEGIKHDQEKPRYDLIPPEALDALAGVLTIGAQRYGERNWETGFKWGRIFAAAMRHMWTWWRGQDIDPDSGKPHLHCALCNLVFLVTFEARKAGEDDRRRADD